MLRAYTWLKAQVVPLIKIVFHLSRAMSLATHRTPSTSSSTAVSCVPGFQRLLTSRNPCADPLERGRDGYTDPEPLTDYEPNRIVDNQIINEQEDITCTEDNQIAEIVGHVNSLPY